MAVQKDAEPIAGPKLFPGPIVLTTLAIAAVLILGYVAGLCLARRARSNLAEAEREIGRALREPGIKLSDVPAELRAFEVQLIQFQLKTLDLEQKNKALETRLQQADLGPDGRRALSLSDCLTDTSMSAKALAAVDPDFESVAGALDLISGLGKAAQALRGLPDGASFVQELGRLLDQGHLDVPLTASAILEKYFTERSSWREVRISMRAADALLISLLDRAGVHIVDVPILSIIESVDARDMQLSDRRGLRSIPAIQQKAARIARELQPNEILVVDCHKPGWISDGFGSRAPQLAIFDPSSWT